MDDFLTVAEKTKDLSPKERRQALLPVATRQNISSAFLQIVNGSDNRRMLLRAVCDLSGSSAINGIIQHNLEIHKDKIESLLLYTDDPKFRKNLALLLGRIDADLYLDFLFKALNLEKTNFVVPSIILAIGNVQARKKEGFEFLSSYSVDALTEIDQKQKAEIEVALSKALQRLSGEKTCVPLPKEIQSIKGLTVTLKCSNAQVTRHELSSLGYESVPQKRPDGYLEVSKVSDFYKLFSLRSFYEAFFHYKDFKNFEEAIKGIASNEFLVVIRELYQREDLSYRVDIQTMGDPIPQGERKKIAENLAFQLGRNSRLVNSPSDYSFEIRLMAGYHEVKTYIVPFIEDTRFDYKKANISASMHPSVAASCLSYVSHRLKKDADVLDCFCGSGTFLFERAQYPYKSLTGTDISSDALKAARLNERSAKTGAHFLIKNATSPFRETYDEVICNMPFGLRVSNHKDNYYLYKMFMENLTSILRDNGTAFLFTHEKKLITDLLSDEMVLVDRKNFMAGGLFPTLFVIQKRK